MKIKSKILSSIVILLFILQYDLNAQQEHYILPLGDDLLLHQQERASPVVQTFEVIDLTGDSTLGYLKSSEDDNNRTAIYAPINKQEWLSATLEANDIAKVVKSVYSFLLIVTDISVGGNESESYAKIKGNLYESPLGSDSYTFSKPIDEFSINKSVGLKGVANVVANIVKAGASASGVVAKTDLKPKSKAEIIELEREKLSFINNEVFPTGIYMNFDEFKALKPSYTEFYVRVDTASKDVEINGFRMNDTALQKVENAFAIAVNNELYIYKQNRLYPVEARGNMLFFSKFVDADLRKNNAAFWRLNIGELMSTRTYLNPFDNVYTLMINEYKGSQVNKEAIKINAENGNLDL